jgi:hypothetical protein
MLVSNDKKTGNQSFDFQQTHTFLFIANTKIVATALTGFAELILDRFNIACRV